MHDDQTLSDRSTEGMVDYNAHSSAQQSMVATHAATIRKLVQSIGSVRPEFRIADYGCGPGDGYADDTISTAVSESSRPRPPPQ